MTLRRSRDMLMRVVIAALFLCVLSFAVGVVGDLSLAQPPGPSATVAIPPNAVRAHPLPPLPRTDSADAAPIRQRAHAWAPQQKPRDESPKAEPKFDRDFAPKAAHGK
jgi:hypothetical protein